MRDAFPFLALIAVLIFGMFLLGNPGGGPHPLVGMPAPPLELALLEGGIMNLAEHRDTDIVLLDFWATWCPPCVASMPALEELAGEFAARNVVLYAVNQNEDPQTIHRFLERHRIGVNVAMDPGWQAGRAYGVEGIPQLVVIDKNGIVQAVHIGAGPDLKPTLRRQLDTLVQGRSLVEPRDI